MSEKHFFMKSNNHSSMSGTVPFLYLTPLALQIWSTSHSSPGSKDVIGCDFNCDSSPELHHCHSLLFALTVQPMRDFPQLQPPPHWQLWGLERNLRCQQLSLKDAECLGSLALWLHPCQYHSNGPAPGSGKRVNPISQEYNPISAALKRPWKTSCVWPGS